MHEDTDAVLGSLAVAGGYVFVRESAGRRTAGFANSFIISATHGRVRGGERAYQISHGISLLEVASLYPIQAPLGDVAVHIVEAPIVGKITAHGDGLSIVRRVNLVVLPVAVVAPELRKIGIPVVGNEIGAVVQTRFRSSAAGILPLRFRGKTESEAGHLVQQREEAAFARDGVEVDAFHRTRVALEF